MPFGAFFTWFIKVKIDYQKLPKTKEMLQEDKSKSIKLYKAATFAFLWMFMFLYIPYLYPPPIDDVLNKLIAKYYTPDEIIEKNIHVVKQISSIELSNGDVLPHEDYMYLTNYIDIWYHLPLLILVFFLYKVIVYLLFRKE